MNSSNIIVVLGCGGMGLPVARRLGVGRRLFIADFSDANILVAESTLAGEGYTVSSAKVDVSDFTSVSEFAQKTAAAGSIEAIVHTAGLSPSAGSARLIYEVDLLGTANVIDAFFPFAQLGTSLVCVSSMAGHLCPPLKPDLERHLATASRDQLLNHPGLNIDGPDLHGPPQAYALSKRGNLLRIQAAASAWGLNGARVNSVSPGVISTEAGRQEIAGPAGKFVASSPIGRVGTPQDIVNAVAFLVSPESCFITGNDILVDGGVVSSLRWKS